MGAGTGGLCGPMVHVPFGGSTEGPTPALVPGEASRWLQPRGDTAGGGEDRLCSRGSTDGDSCVREDRPQMSSSTGGLCVEDIHFGEKPSMTMDDKLGHFHTIVLNKAGKG
jgi:hypothetical protein